MAETTAKVGSAEWFSQSADKILDFGLDLVKGIVLKDVTEGSPESGGTSSSSNTNSKLPYILGGVAVLGIVILLWKR
jgi:hypothetical protein